MADADLDFNAHPDAEKLQGFGQGLLAPEEAETLEEHLAICDECCRQLEATPNDSFVGQLREAQELPATDTLHFTPSYSTPADESLGDLADHPRYRVIRLLGRGGMGAVYLAEHRRMGRLVALKVINPELLNHAGALLRFQQEVKTAAKLDHANIVAAYDADQAGNSHFLVMEYVEGQNLSDYLAENGPLPVAQACDIIRQAALGLQHAHERGMVHRDIKPHNLMLTPTGEVKVLDFGLARLATEAAIPTRAEPGALVSHLTGAGAVMGTADYIAPEQARDAHLADGRSDIYSLGCTLYHLLTGQPPFPKGTTREKVQLHSTNFPLWLRDARAEIRKGLARIVAKMMAKKPEDRFQTATEVAAALKPHAGTIRAKRGKLRRGLVACGVLVVAAAFLACAAWFFRPATDYSGDFDEGANRAPEQPAVAKVGELRRWKPHDKWYVTRISVSPDGHSAWSVGQNDVRRWDVATQKVAQWSLTPHWIEEFALSPDGKQILATDGETGVIRIFDADTLDQVREFELGRGWMRYSEAAWFPDGQQILTGGLDGVARIWDVKDGKPVREFKGHTAITCVAISQDGTKILTGSNTDRIIKVWNLQTNEVICSFEEQNSQSNSARFVLEGKALLSCGRDNAIHLFDAQTGKEIRKFAIAAEGIRWNEIAIYRDGRHFVASDPYDGNLGLWDLETGKELYKVGTNYLVCALAITADNRDVLLGTESGQIIQWRLPAVVPTAELPAVVPPAANRASLKDLPLQAFYTDNLPVHAVAISPDDKLVAAGGGLWRPFGGRWTEGSDFDVRLFDRQSGQELRRFKGPTKPVFAVAFSPDGQQIAAVGTGDKRAYLWDVNDGKLLHTLVGHTGAVIGISFLCEGKQLLTTSFDKSARLWDATTGLEIRRLGNGIEADWGTAAFLPGERKAVLGGFGMLVIADAETGAVLQKLPWPGGRVVQMGVSPDGARLLTAGGDQSDGRLRLWDLTTGKPIRTFDRLPARNTLPLPSIPSGCILRVAYLPDGNRCLTAEGNVSRIHDVHTGKVLHTFDGHADCVMAIAVSSKGRYAVSGGLDQKVHVWRLPEPAAPKKADGK